MLNKFLSRLIMPVAAVVLLASCGGESPEEIGSQFDINESHEVIFLNIHASAEESINTRYLNHLRSKFPHWTFTYKTRSSSVGSADYVAEVVVTGEKFDIFMDPINDANIYTSNGLELDMEDLMKKHNLDLSRIESSTIDEIRNVSGGKIHGLPILTSRTMLFYNKEIFNKFGVPFPKDGATWDETIELSKRLDREDGGVQYLGFSSYANHVFPRNQYSIPLVDGKTDKPTINTDPKWKKYFETIWILTAQQDGYKAEMEKLKREPNYNNFYKDKNLAMYLYQSSLPFSTKDMETFDWDIATLPVFSDLPDVGSQGSPSYMGISKVSENKDAAMIALKHLLSDETQIANSRQGLMTILKDENVQKEFGKESSFTGKNWAAMYKHKYAPVAPKTPYDSIAASVYVKYARLIQRGEIDINTAFRQAEEEATQGIEQEKAKAK